MLGHFRSTWVFVWALDREGTVGLGAELHRRGSGCVVFLVVLDDVNAANMVDRGCVMTWEDCWLAPQWTV